RRGEYAARAIIGAFAFGNGARKAGTPRSLRTTMSIRLPYAWARAHRALIQSGVSGELLTTSPRTPSWALDEIRRRHGELPQRQVSDSELDTLLAAAYAQTGDAAAVVDAAANEIDLDRLMQDIPEIED